MVYAGVKCIYIATGESGKNGEGGVGGREARNGKNYIIKIQYVSQIREMFRNYYLFMILFRFYKHWLILARQDWYLGQR